MSTVPEPQQVASKIYIAISEDQLPQLLEQFKPKPQSRWEYWKEKLILPVSLTLAGTLITLLVGLIQSKQAQDNFENSLQITRIQSREKYLSYFTDGKQTRVNRLPALGSLIDLGATDLAGDLLTLNIGESNNDEHDFEDQEKIDRFVLTTGTKLLPRLCYLASYSHNPLNTLAQHQSDAPVPLVLQANQPPADIALSYAEKLAAHPRERSFLESLAFGPPKADESATDAQIRDGAAIVLSALVSDHSRSLTHKKGTEEKDGLGPKFAALLLGDRSDDAKWAALAALYTLGRYHDLLQAMTSKDESVVIRDNAAAALFRGPNITAETSEAVLKLVMDPETPYALRCDLAGMQPEVYKDHMLQFIASSDLQQRRFAIDCVLDGFSGIGWSVIRDDFRHESDIEIKKRILGNIGVEGPSTEELEIVMAGLKDNDPQLRALAYEDLLLKSKKSSEEERMILKGLHDSDSYVIRAIVNKAATSRIDQRTKSIIHREVSKSTDSEQKGVLLHILSHAPVKR